MESLRAMCAERSFLLVGDSKLVSFDNLRQIIAAGVDFIAPASKLYISREVLAACDFDEASTVDYLAQRDAISQRISEAATRVVEDRFTLEAPKKAKHPGLDLRRVFVWSSTGADVGPGEVLARYKGPRGASLRQLQGAPRRRTGVLEEQPADRSAAQRGLLGLVDLLSRRTRGTTSHRPGAQDHRARRLP
jgi:hypothetical protein